MNKNNAIKQLKGLEETAQEVPVQEQHQITLDLGVIESSKLYITTDKDFYDGMKESDNFIPILTPNDFRESLHISMDSPLYIFRVSPE